jgi:transposase
MKRRRVDVNLSELDQLLDQARETPLSEPDCNKIKTALHTLADLLAPRTTEKTSEVAGADSNNKPEKSESDEKKKPNGHGRNPASAYTGAKKVPIAHAELKHGADCPECEKGKVYTQKEPKPLVRIVGQAPLAATVYELERLRCNACGQMFTAAEPEGVGPDKFDETASAMIALLKYGSGVPFNRLADLEKRLGIPLPSATAWEVVEEEAEVVKPVWEELIRQAAQSELMHHDDTGMRVLQLARPPGDERTGVFTTGVVSIGEGRRIALYFTGREHAGENVAQVLSQRAASLSAPMLMCDALSRNEPKLGDGVEILLANCLAHGRRHYVDLIGSFPKECRYVLETLGKVYANDSTARERGLSKAERLALHQEHSKPLLEQLRKWGQEQLAQHKTEPNSGLGKAITYFERHWNALTLFLRAPGAPLDNNVCERALKKAVLHRKNALFYRTLHGAEVGDIFMSLIHTCELNQVNAFEYLVQLQRHAAEVTASPAEWMPWNYTAKLAVVGLSENESMSGHENKVQPVRRSRIGCG